MRNQMTKMGIAALTLTVTAGLASAQDGAAFGLAGAPSTSVRGGEAPVTGVELLAIDTFTLGDDAIAVINTSPPAFTALTGDIPQLGVCPEIEYAQDGFIYALDTGVNTLLHRLTASGAFVETFTITFPAGYDVLTSAEWVNGGLVVGAATEGGLGNAGIGRLALNEAANTATFAAGPFDLGVGGALGGIAYDSGLGIFYAVTSAGSTPALLTIDGNGFLLTNTPIMEGGVAAPGMTGLEFGSDGQLYACSNSASVRRGELFIVNRQNAQCMSLGQTGLLGMTGLTSRAGCSEADLAAPFGSLDFSDVIAFLSAFGAGCP